MPHPLATLIRAAARGEFPPVDGGWHRVPPWREGLEAVLAFTGHAVLAVGDRVSDADLSELDPHGYGKAHHPRVLCALARGGVIDCLDVLLVSTGIGGGAEPDLVPRPDLGDHPRAQLAARLRDDVSVYGRPDAADRSVALLSRGIAGLPEISYELDPVHRGAGGGPMLIRALLRAVPAGEFVVSASAPGNAASLRSLLAAGFVPIGSVQLFTPGEK